MSKYVLAALVVTMAIALPAHAQQAERRMEVPCPSGTQFATIRRNAIKPGKIAEFERAVVDHTAWYARKGSATVTRIARIVNPRGSASALSASEVVTITKYGGKQPERDAGYAAFIARYKASSTIKDEMRVCLPAL